MTPWVLLTGLAIGCLFIGGLVASGTRYRGAWIFIAWPTFGVVFCALTALLVSGEPVIALPFGLFAVLLLIADVQALRRLRRAVPPDASEAEIANRAAEAMTDPILVYIFVPMLAALLLGIGLVAWVALHGGHM